MNSPMVAMKDSVVAERAGEPDKILLKEMRLIPLWSSSIPYGVGSKILILACFKPITITLPG